MESKAGCRQYTLSVFVEFVFLCIVCSATVGFLEQRPYYEHLRCRRSSRVLVMLGDLESN